MQDLVKIVSKALRIQGKRLVTAESCTGGMFSAALTDQAGSSDIFERGFITYSNDAKMDHLSVKKETLETYGAVSTETASEMANGALENSKADIAVSITGIAGPGGGSPEKPVGCVCFGIAAHNMETLTYSHIFPGDRKKIRENACIFALEKLIKILNL